MSTSANPVAYSDTASLQSSTTTKRETSVDRRRLIGLLLSTAACLLTEPVEARSVGSAAAAALRRRALARQAPKQSATTQPPDKPRDVVIHRSKHPEAAAHIDHAQGKASHRCCTSTAGAPRRAGEPPPAASIATPARDRSSIGTNTRRPSPVKVVRTPMCGSSQGRTTAARVRA